ncbi:WD40 repeat-like protein [Atractiella rhizophila]|nr:WD40 repeat-like protein [Atractiella rhizophila]
MARWKLLRQERTHIAMDYPLRPTADYTIEMLPPEAYTNRSLSICTRYVHTSTNKVRCPVNVVRWTPEGRRILTGLTSGEFTLWNGLTFNFESLLQAHDTAVRSFTWSHSGQWLVSVDQSGIIKYFSGNMNNLTLFQGHNDCIRDVSFSPNDMRFVTCGDDAKIKLWNFEERREERTLEGHLWDVKAVRWHMSKGLIVSGGKDNQVKFWDPRTATCLTTLYGHKGTVQAVEWCPDGHLVGMASRDQLVKVYDIRTFKEVHSLRAHKKEVCSLAWHPHTHSHLVTGGSEGSILYWDLNSSTPTVPVDNLEFAHDSNVWSLAFNNLGTVLCSGSNDHTTRFWSRGRPGGKLGRDRFHVGKEKAKELGGEEGEEGEEESHPALPGLGLSNSNAQQQNQPSNFASLPSLGGGMGMGMSGMGMGQPPALPVLPPPPQHQHQPAVPDLFAMYQAQMGLSNSNSNSHHQPASAQPSFAPPPQFQMDIPGFGGPGPGSGRDYGGGGGGGNGYGGGGREGREEQRGGGRGWGGGGALRSQEEAMRDDFGEWDGGDRRRSGGGKRRGRGRR